MTFGSSNRTPRVDAPSNRPLWLAIGLSLALLTTAAFSPHAEFSPSTTCADGTGPICEIERTCTSWTTVWTHVLSFPAIPVPVCASWSERVAYWNLGVEEGLNPPDSGSTEDEPVAPTEENGG